MVTKSKKYNKKYNNFLFTTSFWVCVICFLAALATGIAGSMIFYYIGIHYPINVWQAIFPWEYSLTLTEDLDWICGVGKTCLITAVLCTLAALISFVYCMIKVGERNSEGNVILKKCDRFPSELQLCIFVLTVSLGGYFTIIFLSSGLARWVAWKLGLNLYHQAYTLMGEPQVVAYVLAAVIGGSSTVIGLWMLVSMVRKIKAGAFIRNSLFGMIFLTPIKNLYNGSSVMKKMMLLALGTCLVSATVVLAPIMFIIIAVFGPKWVKKYEQIKIGVEEVKNGNLSYKIPISGTGELESLAMGINQIAEASNVAIQNELKNQRMKTELISNVSHDIKTPLTSIVTYIDLLKTEGLDSENAPEYLRVLEQKTIRLKQLTEDLFEAAKASSGTIPMNITKVELVSLVNQTLGELDEKVRESGLEFIMGDSGEKYYAYADGQYLWRVIENLIGNVFKYAQENSRVYIDMSEGIMYEDGESGEEKLIPMILLEIKNVSKQRLNISAEELMERFTRGDESRSTEGSGLGLSIAKDLTKGMGGRFDIFIDGDLFKVRVALRKYTEHN